MKHIIGVRASSAHGDSKPLEAQFILRFFQPFKHVLLDAKRASERRMDRLGPECRLWIFEVVGKVGGGLSYLVGTLHMGIITRRRVTIFVQNVPMTDYGGKSVCVRVLFGRTRMMC
jgi:hypothetical protein